MCSVITSSREVECVDKDNNYVQKASSIPLAHWVVTSPVPWGGQNSSKSMMRETPGEFEAGGLNLQVGIKWGAMAT